MEKFNIPVVLFIFKRYETTKRIIDVLRQINVSHIYLIGDGARNDEEQEYVSICRKEIETYIDWDCEVTKNYAERNRGVMENIGNGARWVFTHEREAIFLEDDNLPQLSFFRYCSEMLEEYKNNEKILWVTGTNYLGEYEPEDGSSYMFTQHLLPCGWASWSHKFLKYYDIYLDTIDDVENWEKLKISYENKMLFKQQRYSIYTTKRKIELNHPVSWDFQMCFSLRCNDLYGISPSKNQIKNIGVDMESTHGGVSYKIEMVNRFCSMDSFPFQFPLKKPRTIEKDAEYEKNISKIILWPIKTQIQYRISFFIKLILGLNKYDSLSYLLKNKRRK